MVVLNHQNSPITRAERLRLNENWVTIVNEFLKIQRQFNIITGGKEVDELLQRIESTITSAEASIADINELITDVRALIVTTNETIESANTAASNANAKATEAQQATQAANTATASALQAITDIEQIMGEYETRVNATISNSESATAAATTATQEAITAKGQTEQATQAANTATTAANESSSRADASAQNADNAASNANQVAQNMSGYDKPIEEFTLGKTFLKHQAARFNGSTYRAKVETTGNPLPVDPVVENEWWTLEAKRGTDGEGSVGSVNGKLPDDNGNVEIDVTGGGTWDELAGKPETFPPRAHGHKIADVEGLQDALDNTASTWDDIEGKPEKFPPSTHGHEIADINGLNDKLVTDSDKALLLELTGIPNQVNQHIGDTDAHLRNGERIKWDKLITNIGVDNTLSSSILSWANSQSQNANITLTTDYRPSDHPTIGAGYITVLVSKHGVSSSKLVIFTTHHIEGNNTTYIRYIKDTEWAGGWSKIVNSGDDDYVRLLTLLDRFDKSSVAISDCNSAIYNGIYMVESNALNAPERFIGSLEVFRNETSLGVFVIQRCTGYDSSFERRSVDNDWEAWTETSPTKLFQSVSDGKKLVANAITGKGVSTAVDASFATMASNITEIPSGGKQSSRNIQITIPQGATQHNILHDLSFPFPIKDAEIFYRRISLDIHGIIISTGQSVAYSSGNPTANIYDTGGIWYNGSMNGVVLPNLLGSQERTHISGNTLKIRSTIYSQNPLPAQTVEATIRVRG